MTARTRSRSIPGELRAQERYQNLSYLQSTLYVPSTTIVANSSSLNNVTIPGRTETMFDHVHKDFAKKRAKGMIYNNPMFITSEFTDSIPIFAEQTVRTYRNMTNTYTNSNVFHQLHTTDTRGGQYTIDQIATGRTGYLTVPDASTVRDLQSLQDLAVTSAWASMGDSDILIGACIAESGKTLSGLLSCARKVIKVAKVLKRPGRLKYLSRKSIKDQIRAYEDARMEVRYGLRPLYYDILGVMKLTTKPYGIRNTFRGQSSDESSLSDTWTGISSVFSNTTVTIERTSTRSIHVRAGVLAEGREQTLWNRMGVSLISETAWELAPFSFIADWFGNFGDYISMWSPKPGVKYLASWIVTEQVETQKIRCVTESTYEWTKTTPFQRGAISKIETETSGCSGQKTLTKRYLSRFPHANRPVLPTMSVNLNPQKLLDLATIGRQVSRIFR